MKDGKAYLFLLNHNAEDTQVDIGANAKKELLSGETLAGTVTVSGRGVLILEDK
ncbi:hypothetical protein HMSSN036_45770 [Paenibacillus macerans]|nr:hypothetical protein HMSSN036_45770 [Paenibacillus macerans]